MKTLSVLSLSIAGALAQDGITFGPSEGPFRLDLRTSLEAILWSGDTPAPALLNFGDSAFLAPRLSFDIDAAYGDHWLLHATPRIDRGFDAGSARSGELRLDELFLRWRVLDDQKLNFQIGKYASVFGAWSAQHDFFDDPFLLAPLPYSQIIGVSPLNPANPTNTGVLPLSLLPKDRWASILWGPGYGTGASVFGATEHFDYALEVKNSALSSHPDSWERLDFSHPTVTARVGYRPDAAWAFGLSASRGSWPEVNAAGVDRDDLVQNSLGLDARWSHHNLIVSGEVILSEFETARSGDLQTASWFLQMRYKLAPGFWLAGRFGQILANDAVGPGGTDIPWQSDVWRAEFGAGWRLRPNLLLKAGYTFTHTEDDPVAGEHLWGTGVGWRF